MLPYQNVVWFLFKYIYQKWINITSFARKSNTSQPVWRFCREQRHSLAHEYSSRLTSATSTCLWKQVGQIQRGHISGCCELCCTEYLKRLVLGFLAAVCVILALVFTENVPCGKRFVCSFCCSEQNKKKEEMNLQFEKCKWHSHARRALSLVPTFTRNMGGFVSCAKVK